MKYLANDSDTGNENCTTDCSSSCLKHSMHMLVSQLELAFSRQHKNPRLFHTSAGAVDKSNLLTSTVIKWHLGLCYGFYAVLLFLYMRLFMVATRNFWQPTLKCHSASTALTSPILPQQPERLRLCHIQLVQFSRHRNFPRPSPSLDKFLIP